VKLLWVPGYSDIVVNEKAKELARLGSGSKFCAPKCFIEAELAFHFVCPYDSVHFS
jgi:uncharacterized Zn-finger protein